MDFLKLAQERYSCRKFEDKPVEDEKIDALLQAAQLAPTAVNFQPQRILVLTDKEKKRLWKKTNAHDIHLVLLL